MCIDARHRDRIYYKGTAKTSSSVVGPASSPLSCDLALNFSRRSVAPLLRFIREVWPPSCPVTCKTRFRRGTTVPSTSAVTGVAPSTDGRLARLRTVVVLITAGFAVALPILPVSEELFSSKLALTLILAVLPCWGVPKR